MKLLLVAINAKYIHSNPAIYSLRGYAGVEAARHIELAEYTINQQLQDILEDIYRRKPDVIGFSCYIWNWTFVRQLLAELPKLLPGTALWLGGPEVTYDADRLLAQYPKLTGIMVGEGEATFRELAAWYLDSRHGTAEAAAEGSAAEGGRKPAEGDKDGAEKGSGVRKKRLEDIPGLYLHTGPTPARQLLDMSSVPFLYGDLAPFENRIIYYESSRGCPYSCSYCLSSIEKSVRIRDIGAVKKELQFFLDSRVKQVKFVDRTFNCNHAHAMAVWKYLRDNDNGVTNFHFEISADILNEQELELLHTMRPGLVQLEIGVQSTNPDTLRAVRRVSDMERLERIVAEIGKGGNIHRHLDLIAGLPFEDMECFRNSFDRVYGMRPEQLQLGFLKVLKGSEMWERAEEFGIRCLDSPPYEVLCTRWLDYEDILRLKGVEEMVELYYNSGQFTRTLPVLESAFDSPFAMYDKLAAFYLQEGCGVKSTVHSPDPHAGFGGQMGVGAGSSARVYRYHVLLAFAARYDEERLPLYRELLTLDLYLRENLKSRPEFASDLTPYRDVTRSFYRQEEKKREYLPDYEGCDGKQLSRLTHLEPFSRLTLRQIFPGDRDGEAGEEAAVHYVLFDYRHRNPLNAEARTLAVRMPDGTGEAADECRQTARKGEIVFPGAAEEAAPEQCQALLRQDAGGMEAYVSIDLETTGLNPKRDRIIEIGAVKVVQGNITDTFSTLVNPGRRLEQRITELTGITDEDLKDAPYLEEVLPELFSFLGELPLLGHSILFDFSFLKKAAVDRKQCFEKKAIDTLKIARKYLSRLESRSLDALCLYYRIPHRAHRALADAEATDLLYRRLTEEFYSESEGLFRPGELFFQVKRDQPASKSQKERLYWLAERHKIILDVEIDHLTRSEASRLTDKLLEQYGRDV